MSPEVLCTWVQAVRDLTGEEVSRRWARHGVVVFQRRLPVVKTHPACKPVWLGAGGSGWAPANSGEAILVVLTVPGQLAVDRGRSSLHTLAAEGPAGRKQGVALRTSPPSESPYQ